MKYGIDVARHWNGEAHVVFDELESCVSVEVRNVRRPAGAKIVDDDSGVASIDQCVYDVRP